MHVVRDATRCILLLISMQACKSEQRNAPDLELASAQHQQKRKQLVPSVDTGNGNCLPLWPAQLRLSGRVRQDKKFGPPGYGENPKEDQMRTIFVLVLDRPVDVCADTTEVAPQPLLRHATEMQLTENFDGAALARHIGSRLDVFGTLRRRAWPTDYTEAIVRVDSVPQLENIPKHAT